MNAPRALRAEILSYCFAVTLGAAACSRTAQPPFSADAGGSSAAHDAGSAAPVLQVTVLAEPLDGGTFTLTGPSVADRPLVAPVRELTVQTNLALVNARVRLFDESDRTVPSDDDWRSDEAARLDYRIHFQEPLKPGHAYELVLDAETGAELMDSTGSHHPDIRIPFGISGDREKAPPAPPKRRRR